MPSEKSRYLNKDCVPSAPLNFTELKQNLPSFGIKRLVEILWMSSQRDHVLRKALMVSVGIQLADGNLEKAKAAIDYALHFPDYIRYNDRGYGLILSEIRVTLECLEDKINKEFVLSVAQYAFELGQVVSENFEDDWDWISDLEDLEHWIQRNKSQFNAED